MAEKRIVRIHEDSNGELRFVDGSGKLHVYAPCVRPIYFLVDSLRLYGGIEELPNGLTFKNNNNQGKSTRGLYGYGQLGDKGISVIGAPETTVNNIKLFIESRTAEEHQKALILGQQADLKDNNEELKRWNYVTHGYCNVFLNHAREDVWECTVYVPEKTHDELISVILGKQARSLRIGFQLRGVYTDNETGCNFHNERVNLFLRPNKSDGDVDNAHSGYGKLTDWYLTYKGTTKLTHISEEEKEELPVSPPIDKTDMLRFLSEANKQQEILNKIMNGIINLRSAVIYSVLFLAITLIIAAFIN
jgi:hypothetical protein